eukprot:1146030-Pelagomonas_calceolata.AAC.1
MGKKLQTKLLGYGIELRGVLIQPVALIAHFLCTERGAGRVPFFGGQPRASMSWEPVLRFWESSLERRACLVGKAKSRKQTVCKNAKIGRHNRMELAMENKVFWPAALVGGQAAARGGFEAGSREEIWRLQLAGDGGSLMVIGKVVVLAVEDLGQILLGLAKDSSRLEDGIDKLPGGVAVEVGGGWIASSSIAAMLVALDTRAKVGAVLCEEGFMVGNGPEQCCSSRAAPGHKKVNLCWPEGPAQIGFGQTGTYRGAPLQVSGCPEIFKINCGQIWVEAAGMEAEGRSRKGGKHCPAAAGAAPTTALTDI